MRDAERHEGARAGVAEGASVIEQVSWCAPNGRAGMGAEVQPGQNGMSSFASPAGVRAVSLASEAR
jgi:hypothetical protein